MNNGVIFEDDNYIQNPDGTLIPKFADGKVTGTREYFIGKKICIRCCKRTVAKETDYFCLHCQEEVKHIEELFAKENPVKSDLNKQKNLIPK
jgi:hypothetical protein